MLARAKKINVSTEGLDTLLSGRTDNKYIDTLPEIVEYINKLDDEVGKKFSTAISGEELEMILV